MLDDYRNVIGAVVKLRSGGPSMTVTSQPHGEAMVECSWFNRADELGKDNFPIEVLHLEVKPPEE